MRTSRTKETFQVLRVTCASLVAISAAAVAMAIKGWQTASLLLAAVIVLLGWLVVLQVSRALVFLRDLSAAERQAAAIAEEHYLGVLRRVMRSVESRDKLTRGRSERIGKLAALIGRRMNLPDRTCELLDVAGQLHDIGLVAIPERILTRRSELAVGDFRTIQRHARVSHEVLAPLRSLAPILPAIRHHHERMNGTGYPDGLSGEAIPLEARVLAVADTYDAMTHDRPHRSAIAPAEAMRELVRCTPAGYDPVCVRALAEIINLSDLAAADPAEGIAQAAAAVC